MDVNNPYVAGFMEAMRTACPESAAEMDAMIAERGLPDDPRFAALVDELAKRFTIRKLSRREQRALDAERERQASEAGLMGALNRCIVFAAYSADDPLAIRFEFANEEDRLAAANAVDATFPHEGD